MSSSEDVKLSAVMTLAHGKLLSLLLDNNSRTSINTKQCTTTSLDLHVIKE